jgi:hypothetical protein
MREKNKDFEHPEQVWKDVYYNELIDLEEERLPQTFPIAHIIERIPSYSHFRSLIVLVLSALACFGVAWGMVSDKLSCGFWSSALLNLGMGLISGCVLWYFTEHRSRMVSGYEAVVKTMLKRYETLQVILNKGLANPHFVLYNMDNQELACEWIYVHRNFILTMQSHFEYWDGVLKDKVDIDFGKVSKIISKKLQDIGLHLENDILKKTKDDLRILCGDVYRLEIGILKSYENRIEILEAKVLDVQFGRRPLSRYEKLKRKQSGGKINDQISLDLALEN